LTNLRQSVIFASYMKTRDVVTGLIVLVLLVSGVLVYKNIQKNKNSKLPTPTPDFQQVESKFPSLKVPENADKASLNSVETATGMGEAFKTYENGKFDLTVIANLETPMGGYFYQAWLVKGNPGDTNFSYVSIGKLTFSKGGYIVNFTANKDYSDYKKVVVTTEKSIDKTPEQHVLEGSF